MKIYYLSKNRFNQEYYLDDGCFSVRRKEIGRDLESLVKDLKKQVNPKRKTKIYVIQDYFPKEALNKVRSLFSGTKVKVAPKPYKDLD